MSGPNMSNRSSGKPAAKQTAPTPATPYDFKRETKQDTIVDRLLRTQNEFCPCRPYCCGVLCAGFVSRASQAALSLRRIVRKPELTRPTIPRTSRSRGPTEPTQRLQNKNKQFLFKQNMNTNLPQKIVCTEYDAQYVTESPQVWDALSS